MSQPAPQSHPEEKHVEEVRRVQANSPEKRHEFPCNQCSKYFPANAFDAASLANWGNHCNINTSQVKCFNCMSKATSIPVQRGAREHIQSGKARKVTQHNHLSKSAYLFKMCREELPLRSDGEPFLGFKESKHRNCKAHAATPCTQCGKCLDKAFPYQYDG